jgi:hypothetical protein
LSVGAIFSLGRNKQTSNRRTRQEKWQVPPWKYSKPNGCKSFLKEVCLSAIILSVG